MKVACLSFTSNGEEIGDNILKNFKKKSNNIEEVKHFRNGSIEGGIRTVLSQVVKEYDGIVFISATGIAVRMMLPFIKDKREDPAVVVVDELGRYSISLLSGHIGGANILCKEIGDILTAQPIITTASDGQGIEAVDMFAIRNNLDMEDMESIKKITSLMVEGKTIGFYSEVEGKIRYPNLVVVSTKEEIASVKKKVDGFLFITCIDNIRLDIPYAILRPKNLNIGIGCRKGIEGKRIVESIIHLLNKNNLSQRCIKSIATISIKKDEKGIIEASKYFNCFLNVFSKSEINEIEYKFQKSQFVKEKVGVFGVCEPCAYLSGGKLIVEKTKYKGITLAVSKEVFYG